MKKGRTFRFIKFRTEYQRSKNGYHYTWSVELPYRTAIYYVYDHNGDFHHRIEIQVVRYPVEVVALPDRAQA